MSIQEKIESKLSDAFAPERLVVINESHLHAGHKHEESGHHAAFDGTGETHFRVRIVSGSFAEKSRIERHRAVNEVLKDLGTKSSVDTNAMASIEKIKGAAKGEGFDRAYITFQLENHEYLRDIADAYLHNSAGATDPMEKQGRLLASLMLAVFKEHVAICKRVNAELKA